MSRREQDTLPETVERKLWINAYQDAALMRCMKRAFVVTEKGYFGLALSTTKQGDLVCVIRGCNVPFVLRETQKGTFELIGEVYVHGIMNGEAVRNAKRGDVKEFEII